MPAWADDPRLDGLEVYRVGGAIRDELLGLSPAEHDFVVVGASPDELSGRGFRAVGRDFPVFLHPDSAEEFALARTERKTAPGYGGFTFHTGPDVTLEQDLLRRDLTINAIAEDREGTLIDPFNGRADLETRTLRHVSPAFVEDPVRLLRLARFATRFNDFTIAPETMALCKRLVDEGEVDHLVAERVWRELNRALMHERPSRFFDVLRTSGALARLLPEVDALWGVPQVEKYHPEVDSGIHTMMVLDIAAKMNAPDDVRFACLVHDLGKALTPKKDLPKHIAHERRGLKPVEDVCYRLKVPRETRALARLVCAHHLNCHRADELRPATLLKLLETLDAFRRPERLDKFLIACEADKRGRLGMEHEPYRQAEIIRNAWRAANTVNARSLAEHGLSGAELGEALRRERVTAIRAGRA